MKAWLANIKRYFAFVHHRRIDSRFGVLPETRYLVEGALAAYLAVLVLVLVADPVYLSSYKSSEYITSGFFEIVTLVGQSDWLLIVTGGIMIILSIWSGDRFRGQHHVVWHRIFLNTYYLFTTVAFSGLATNGLKILFARARPEFAAGTDVWQTSHFTSLYQYGSFPSGHSTTAGALALGLALLFPRFRWYFVVAGGVIALSRPMVEAHFPSDAMAGFLFGAAFSYIYARSFARKRLLFRFGPTGGLELRGEGRGKLHLLPAMVRKSIGGLG